MNDNHEPLETRQFSLGVILLLWAAAALPMALLGWVVAPALSRTAENPGFVRLAVLTAGLIWQCLLILLLLRKQEGRLSWSLLRKRLWLQKPARPLFWLLIIPLLAITALYEMRVAPVLDGYWTKLLPFLREPPLFSLSGYLGSASGKAEMVGAWGTLLLFLASAVFNTFLGEELFFRGLLLPRMNRCFGRLDWAANGLLFGLYHLHQPWGMLGSIIGGMLLYALPTRLLKSSWFGIILHSGQSVFFLFILLGMVLGRA